MNESDKQKRWKTVVVFLLIFIPVIAVIMAFFLMKKGLKKEFTITIK